VNNEVEEKISLFQLFILLLSIYVLISLFIEAAFNLPQEIAKVIQITDNVICIFFLYDFFYRLFQAKNKKKFMKWGWIDLLSSIPMLDSLRYGRLVRVFKIIRILKAVRSTKILVSYLFKNRAKGAFFSVSAISMMLIIFGAIAILNVENFSESNIKTAENAIWWAFVTITTVGYGDYYPISIEGKIIAAVLMASGVGLFGTFTGFVASWFVEEQEKEYENQTLSILRDDISKLNNKIEELEKVIEKTRK